MHPFTDEYEYIGIGIGLPGPSRATLGQVPRPGTDLLPAFGHRAGRENNPCGMLRSTRR
ncbi:hypothetical protein MNBD_PLANCTO03-2062 [hydrothermal vent metagenome]|uniref:Uncharacterized protein n=1 Tax=hydrothermal vent metagenome TaxID=652676 RepID=A0A3B1DB92_9ZZZZ